MKRTDFYFDLPGDLIAKYPSVNRTDCRLLELDGNTGMLNDTEFKNIINAINPNDLLIFNNTRVIPARLYGYKESGGKIEILIERIIDNQTAIAHIRSSKSPKEGATLLITANNENDLGELKESTQHFYTLTMTKRHDTLFELFSPNHPILDILHDVGHMPLPPYIDRPDESTDKERYQTVYAQTEGAVAAPTAGLHFDENLLDAILAKGASIDFVTLHVGAGTFQPVRVDDIKTHTMHSEFVVVSEKTVQAIKHCKAQGGRIFAIGTTSMRSLESAAIASIKNNFKNASDDNTQLEFIIDNLKAFEGDTDIFIYPGYQFKIVDMLVTNFHLPESTLIMLVSAFAGYENTMRAYEHAITNRYQFFSYGDAMLITKKST